MTIEYTYGNTAIVGTVFSLYRVADVTETVQYVLTEEFADSSVELNGVDASSTWSDLAITLSAYAAANNIQPGWTGTTDSRGVLTFSDLPTGLYLLVSSQTNQDGYIYSTSVSLIQLPMLDETDDSWSYEPIVEPKTDRRPVREENETVDISVVKLERR